VASLQSQLYALGYWVDTTNGSFDDSTQQAVWALQKAAGLTRDGTYLIENGKLSHPVKNFRFNESPIFFLNNLELLGPSMRINASEALGAGGATIMPAIKVREFTFSSLSDAV